MAGMNIPKAKAPTVLSKIPKLNPVRPQGNNLQDVGGRWGQEIIQENRRVTGVTPKLIGSYLGSPARLIPRSHALRALGKAKKVSVKGQV
jgi:hypothetical protein